MSTDSTPLSAEGQRLVLAAMRLPESERAKVADELYLSLESDQKDDAEFEVMIARRVAEIDNGTAKLVEWDDLRRELQESIDAARKFRLHDEAAGEIRREET